jgi:hypothetical protein
VTHTDTDVYRALADHLEANFIALEIAWPNIVFKPPKDGYARVSHLPDPTIQASLGLNGHNRHSGLFQVDIFRKSGEGEIVAKDFAGDICVLFKRGLVLVTGGGTDVRIDRPPSITPVIDTPPYIQIPVSISYVVDVQNG